MAVWLAVLFGLIGGSVPGITDRRQRMVSMLAALYLLSMLLIWVVPHLFVGQAFETALTVLVQYGLPVLPVAIIADPRGFPRRRRRRSRWISSTA